MARVCRQKQSSESRLGWIDQKIRQGSLRDIRLAAAKTEKEVARALGISQKALSVFERQRDHRLSDLQRYIEALGGRLELWAIFQRLAVRLRVKVQSEGG